MDQTREENAGWFSALFMLARTSSMSGCVATSLSVSRYLLSLDPLRDPTGTLLILDHYAMGTARDGDARFLIDAVESGVFRIRHEERDGGGEPAYHVCDLIDMPNWAFSYGLALFRLAKSKDFDGRSSNDHEEGDDLAGRASDALRSALRRFPNVLEALLEKNGVDVRGRSFQIDWPSVLPVFHRAGADSIGSEGADDLDADRASVLARHAAADRVARIFVLRNYKLWGGDDTLKWLFDCAKDVVKEAGGDLNSMPPPPPAAALLRYVGCDPADYEEAFRTFPPDANPLDELLVAPALAVDPTGRRMLPRGGVAGGGGGGGGVVGGWEGGGEEEMAQWQQMILDQLGGEVIDPDWPMLEEFWRSLMPWARVDGVPPPLPPNR